MAICITAALDEIASAGTQRVARAESAGQPAAG
jgi:hypothetical protein